MLSMINMTTAVPIAMVTAAMMMTINGHDNDHNGDGHDNGHAEGHDGCSQDDGHNGEYHLALQA